MESSISEYKSQYLPYVLLRGFHQAYDMSDITLSSKLIYATIII